MNIPVTQNCSSNVSLMDENDVWLRQILHVVTDRGILNKLLCKYISIFS